MLSLTDWHPAVAAHSLRAGDNIVAARVLGENLALWRSATGTAQAWQDRCPHRGVRLSLGNIVDGRLACAYHGWEFAADTGRCMAVPSMADLATVPGRECARTYAVAETQQMVWVRLAQDAGTDMAIPTDTADPPRYATAGTFLRSMALHAPMPKLHAALLQYGFTRHAPSTWHGLLAQLPARVFTLCAQVDLSLAHVWLHEAPGAQVREAAFAALRALRTQAEAGAA